MPGRAVLEAALVGVFIVGVAWLGPVPPLVQHQVLLQRSRTRQPLQRR
jgi:hypothetical protein